MADAVGAAAPPPPAQPPPVEDGEFLWRLLNEYWIVPADKGGPRISSAAFKDRTTAECAVSVFRRDMMSNQLRGGNARVFAKAAELTAAVPRAIEHRVEPDVDNDQDISHAVIIPRHKGNNHWERDARTLAKKSIMVDVAPPPAPPPSA